MAWNFDSEEVELVNTLSMTEITIEFVKLVESNPCLYNNSISEYARKDITEKAWAEISLNMCWPVSECKEKWRNLRNGFVKSLKALPSGSAAKSRREYYLTDVMQFVIPFVKPTIYEKEPGNIPTCNSSQSIANNFSEVDTQSTSTNEVETGIIIEFVKLVEANPCLYNHSLSEYARKDVTDRAWTEISLTMNWTVPECKDKWRNLRNGFVKSLKALPSGSGAKSRREYYLTDEMQFVIPFVKPTIYEKEPGNIPTCNSSQSTANNFSEVDTLSTSTNEVETHRTSTMDELVDASTQPPKKKARPSNNAANSGFMRYMAAELQNMEKSMHKADTENPRKMFLLSLLPDIENLNNNNMRLLKIEMMSLIQKYQLAQQDEQSPATDTYVRKIKNSLRLKRK